MSRQKYEMINLKYLTLLLYPKLSTTRDIMNHSNGKNCGHIYIIKFIILQIQIFEIALFCGKLDVNMRIISCIFKAATNGIVSIKL